MHYLRGLHHVWLLGPITITLGLVLLSSAGAPRSDYRLASARAVSTAGAHARPSATVARRAPATPAPARTTTPAPTRTPGPTATPTPPSPFRLFVGPTTDVWLYVHGIEEARHRLLLQIGALGDSRVVEALVHAGSRGVDVRVLYDPNGVGTGVLAQLTNAGVLVRPANPGFSAMTQDTLVVDSRYVLLGTGMLTPDVVNAARSFVVRDVDSVAAAQLAALFYDDWLRRPVTSFVPDIILGPDQSQNTVAHIIELATRTLDVYTSRIDDSSTIDALLSARQRGVTVRVIIAGDAPTVGAASLIKGAVQVRRLDDPLVRGTVILEDDQRAYISSLDLTNAGLTATRGVGFMLDDPGVIQTLRSTFTPDWTVAPIVYLPTPVPTPRPTSVPLAPATPTPRPTP